MRRLKTVRRPPIYPNGAQAISPVAPSPLFRCPHAVHRCPSVDSGLENIRIAEETSLPDRPFTLRAILVFILQKAHRIRTYWRKGSVSNPNTYQSTAFGEINNLTQTEITGSVSSATWYASKRNVITSDTI